MTPKLWTSGEVVYIVDHEDTQHSMLCRTAEEAAAVTRACNHFDELLQAARHALEQLDPRGECTEDATVLRLRDVIAAIDGDMP